MLKKYDLSSGTFWYLFILEKNEGISQNKMSLEIGNDKAMVARTISKLIEQGYVYKTQHEENCSAYKLYLTPKAKEILPDLHEEIESLTKTITYGLSEDEISITIGALTKIFETTQKMRDEE
jgi:DNA-binding MarR family transcriptional regulator